MFQELLSGSDLLQWPILGLVLFFLTFLGVTIYAIFGVKRKRIDHVASLPLSDDDPDPAGKPGSPDAVVSRPGGRERTLT